MYRPRDRDGDFILHSEQSLYRTVVTLGPDMVAGLRIDQLGIHPELPAMTLHTAFQHIAHAQFTRDQLHVNGSTFEREA